MDIQSYRRAEALACQSGISWRKRAAHTPNAFLVAGFPVRVESIADLVQMVDTMQEDRFERYMTELGGLNDADLALLVPALVSFAKFFALTFDSYRAPLPLDTMLGMYAAYCKLDRFMPGARSVLEIGPGCGYMSFFMAQRELLDRYVQIEACESLYMLQYLVNRHCFGLRQWDWAAPRLAKAAWICAELRPPMLAHYPWWKLSSAEARGYDAVFMNAMLTELTPAALDDYVALIRATLKPGGVVIAQCSGGGTLPWGHVVETFRRASLALSHVGEDGFCVPTAVWTNAVLAVPQPLTMAPIIEPGRRIMSKDQIAGAVRTALQA